MTIRTRLKSADPEYLRYRRKADQQWDLAGMARADGDRKAEARHTEQAREFEELAAQIVRNQ